jgi:protein-disulfide isomerase
MSTRAKSAAHQARVSRRAERRITKQRAARQRRAWLFGGTIALALVAALTLILLNRGGGGSASDLSPVVAGAAIDPAIPQSGRVLGNPNAPVTVVEWGDYQCPYCAQFAQQIQPQLIADYVATGKVTFEFRDFAFLDNTLSIGSDGRVEANGNGESVRAADAAACAADQGKFWIYHDTIYANHDGENEGAYSEARLAEMASLAGLDTTAFNQCLSDQTHKSDVEQMFQEANALGINSTPSFVIDGKVVQVGGYDDLKQAIDVALAG